MNAEWHLWIALVVGAFGAGVSVGACVASWDIRRESRNASSVLEAAESDDATGVSNK
jgi:hypothetical protein